MEQFEATEQVMACRDRERRAFEVVGSLVTEVMDPAVKIRLSEVSRHHAWRADQWAELVAEPQPDGQILPAAAENRADDLLSAPPDGATTGSDAVGQWIDAVLDAFVAATDDLLARCDSVADGAVRRVAQRVGNDLRLDRNR